MIVCICFQPGSTIDVLTVDVPVSRLEQSHSHKVFSTSSNHQSHFHFIKCSTMCFCFYVILFCFDLIQFIYRVTQICTAFQLVPCSLRDKYKIQNIGSAHIIISSLPITNWLLINTSICKFQRISVKPCMKINMKCHLFSTCITPNELPLAVDQIVMEESTTIIIRRATQYSQFATTSIWQPHDK